MPRIDPQALKNWAGVVLFFAVATGIGLFVSLEFIGRGASMPAAIFFGAVSGFYIAWLVPFLVYRVYRGVSRFRARSIR